MVSMPVTIPPKSERPDYYSTAEFGELFGRTRQWVTRLIKEGKIKYVRFGNGVGRHYIPADQIEQLFGES